MAAYNELYDYILTMIETELSPGDKLPGARRFAERFSCALPKVQSVLDSLEQSGVIISKERSGSYVRDGYNERILPQNVACSKFIRALTPEQRWDFQREFPDMRLTEKFNSGGMEIFSSFRILSRQQQYEDLGEIFEETFPDWEKSFYADALKMLSVDGKLHAVPLIYSPQLLWFNADMFKETDTPLPSNDWKWEDFLNAIRSLHRKFSGRRIINYSTEFQHWVGFILASGGLFFGNDTKSVLADSAKTVDACLRYVNLLRELDLVEDSNSNATQSFSNGKLAMFAGFRQSSYYFREYGIKFTPQAVYMPDLGGGVNHPGAALIAFRKGFFSRDKIKNMLRFWLSESIQNTLGREGYGIPFLRSAALDTLDKTSVPDKYLLERMPTLTMNYHVPSEELGSILSKASHLVNRSTPEELPEILKELSSTLRFINKINLKRS